jgi:hypothetical protein
MKLAANRGARDAADIEFLLQCCDVTSIEHAQQIYERYHVQDVLTDSARARVQRWLDQRPASRMPDAVELLHNARDGSNPGPETLRDLIDDGRAPSDTVDD